MCQLPWRCQVKLGNPTDCGRSHAEEGMQHSLKQMTTNLKYFQTLKCMGSF